jgi:putative hydrolase of the HAD superfamily
MRPEAIFFDLDETLLDGSAGFDSAVRRSCELAVLAHPQLSVERLIEADIEAFTACWREMADDWHRGRISGRAYQEEGWRRTLRLCDCVDEALVQDMLAAFGIAVGEAYVLFEDVLPLLDNLSERTRLAVITNGASDTQREKLGAVGLLDRIDLVVASADIGFVKPEAAIFDHALAQLSLNCSGVWHVGDRLEIDVLGAHNAGLTSVWLNRLGAKREPNHPTPHHEIASLGELLNLLESS